MKILKDCSFCGKEFTTDAQATKFCSGGCRAKAKRSRAVAGTTSLGHQWTTSPGTTGAITELMVSTDLMQKGYHVFRALSPSCPCDLIVYREDIGIKRVEVKTGRIKINGTQMPVSKSKRLKPKDFDILAIVYPTEIIYQMN